MDDASSERIARQRESRRVGRRAGGELNGDWYAPFWGGPISARQRRTQPAVVDRQNPHGVKSVSKADKGKLTEPRNLNAISKRMIEVTDDHGNEGRNPRSSPRTGKPFTWRRGIVDRACKQEIGSCPTR